jgi:hypothetical protein
MACLSLKCSPCASAPKGPVRAVAYVGGRPSSPPWAHAPHHQHGGPHALHPGAGLVQVSCGRASRPCAAHCSCKALASSAGLTPCVLRCSSSTHLGLRWQMVQPRDALALQASVDVRGGVYAGAAGAEKGHWFRVWLRKGMERSGAAILTALLCPCRLHMGQCRLCAQAYLELHPYSVQDLPVSEHLCYSYGRQLVHAVLARRVKPTRPSKTAAPWACAPPQLPVARGSGLPVRSRDS